MLRIGIWPRVRLAGHILIRIDLLGIAVMQFFIVQTQRLLHHYRGQFALAAALLVGGIANGVAQFVVDDVLAVIAQIALKGCGPAHPPRFINDGGGFAGELCVARGFRFDLLATPLRGRT